MKPSVLLLAPTALDYEGQPIKKKRLYLPGLTLMSLASVTPDDVDLTLVKTGGHRLSEPGDLRRLARTIEALIKPDATLA